MDQEIIYLRMFKENRRDRIGVSFNPEDVGEESGVRITAVHDDGQAAIAGLQVWDKVLSINGGVLDCPLEAARLLRQSEGEITLCVERTAEVSELHALTGSASGFVHEESADSSAESDDAGPQERWSESSLDVHDDTPAWLLNAESVLHEGHLPHSSHDEYDEPELEAYLEEQEERPLHGGVYEKRSLESPDEVSSPSSRWASLLPLACGPWSSLGLFCNKVSEKGPYAQEPRPTTRNVSFSLIAVQNDTNMTML